MWLDFGKQSKSQIKYGVFMHIFNDISTNAYIFQEYFLNNFKNFNYEFHTIIIMKYLEIHNIIHVTAINNYYKCVIWNCFPKFSHMYSSEWVFLTYWMGAAHVLSEHYLIVRKVHGARLYQSIYDVTICMPASYMTWPSILQLKPFKLWLDLH